MGRGEHCEDGREVDVAKEEVEREEAQGYQVLGRGLWHGTYELFCKQQRKPHVPEMDPNLR